MDENILKVKDLQVRFETEEGSVQAVDRVGFTLKRGETLGLVGESGCGKSVTNLALLGLVPSPPGKIVGGEALYRGENLLEMSAGKLSRIRGNRIAMIFQDPMTSLNPFMTIADQMTEVTMLHLRHTYSEALKHAISMLGNVGIASPESRIHGYPHQFSGGMRQRVMIAMALSCKPEILIAD
ncbi:MAG: ABC transporter ATP-binding protein, partial [Pirellulales bacterium]|nr:ABC transporter ATP-binding protein [Pirellulales bacterium]